MRSMHALFLLWLLRCSVADEGLHAGDDLYRFVSRPDLMPPRWNITYYDRSRVAPGYWFVAPYRFSDNGRDDVKWTPCQVGPTIYDGDGELVWSSACQFNNRIVFDFGVTNVNGEQVLKGIMKHAQFPKSDCGAGFFLNSSYGLQQSLLVAKDNSNLNQHEFNIEEDGSFALVITHGFAKLSGSDLGLDKEVSVRTDGFKEIDVRTGKTMFEWKTEEHVSLDESSVGYHGEANWDAYHTNSITKNSDGDYLVSIRHLDSLFLVSGSDGNVIWRFGGVRNDVERLGGLRFSRQHHARYLSHNSTHSIISLMHNAKGDDAQPATTDYSRGLIIELEHNKATLRARQLREYRHPQGGISNKRGNVQLLPNGNVFLAWASAGLISEHTPDDRVLMEAHWLKETRFASYRAFKFSWIGRPEQPPDIKAVAYGNPSETFTVIHASWNGATEHRSWQFHNAGGGILGRTTRTGFETVFSTKHARSRVFAEALDAGGNVLGKSEVVDVDYSQDTSQLPPVQSPAFGSLESAAKLHPLLAGCISILSILGLTLLVRAMLRLFASCKQRRYERVPTAES